MRTETRPGRSVLLPDAVADLRARIAGEVVIPGDLSYDKDRTVWNGVIDRRPAVIVRCTGTADVITALAFAKQAELPIAVRGGGHNVAGHAVVDDGLVIDLSPMRGVTVDPATRTVQVQGGATWADVDHETQVFGLAAPGGVVSTTGVGGLTLGGGMGWLRRKHGLSADNLIGAQVVTADGLVVEASADTDPDLLWALRGGGGNFGVVTRFTFRLHPVGPTVAFAGVMYPASQAQGVLRAWRRFMATAPAEVSSQALLWSVPASEGFPEEVHGEPVVAVVAMHCGNPDEGMRLLAPLRALGDPLVDLSGPAPYAQVQRLYDSLYAVGRRYYWKSTTLPEFGDEALERVIEHGRTRPSPDALIVIWHHGGAMSDPRPSDTAYSDRAPSFLISYDTTWDDPSLDAECIDWTRRAWSQMQDLSTGGLYLNFPGFVEERTALVRAAFGRNYDRLSRLKARYDPDNVFRSNANIEPAGRKGAA